MKKVFFIGMLSILLVSTVVYAGFHFGMKGAVKKQTKKVDENVKEEKEMEEQFQETKRELREAEQEKASGNANVGDVRSGKTFSKTGSTGLTGTMPAQSLSDANETISEGYYEATTLSEVDEHLAAANIKKDVVIFGFTGTHGTHELPDTGQYGDYTDTWGEDSDYNPTASSPSYTISGDELTVTDNITGLIWVRDADGPGCNDGNTSTWTVAITFCEDLDFAGEDDWRLPNVRELMSIVDYGKDSAPRINPIFTNTASSYYWTSTTYVPSPPAVWTVDFADGVVDYRSKTISRYVRAVRSGP